MKYIILIIVLVIVVFLSCCGVPRGGQRPVIFTHVVYLDSTDGENGTVVTDTLHKP